MLISLNKTDPLNWSEERAGANRPIKIPTRIPEEPYLFKGGGKSNDQIDDYYGGADVGLAIYGNHTFNHFNAGLSSGKMWNFLKAGVAVVVNDLEVCREAVEDNNAGACIGDISQFPKAIASLMVNAYQKNEQCHRVYETYLFEKYHGKLVEKICDKQ